MPIINPFYCFTAVIIIILVFSGPLTASDGINWPLRFPFTAEAAVGHFTPVMFLKPLDKIIVILAAGCQE
jgi:hypothetical protein